jgi:hypothetical protein
VLKLQNAPEHVSAGVQFILGPYLAQQAKAKNMQVLAWTRQVPVPVSELALVVSPASGPGTPPSITAARRARDGELILRVMGGEADDVDDAYSALVATAEPVAVMSTTTGPTGDSRGETLALSGAGAEGSGSAQDGDTDAGSIAYMEETTDDILAGLEADLGLGAMSRRDSDVDGGRRRSAVIDSWRSPG